MLMKFCCCWLLEESQCDSTTCQNGGTCHEGGDGFLCECSASWEGNTCAVGQFLLVVLCFSPLFYLLVIFVNSLRRICMLHYQHWSSDCEHLRLDTVIIFLLVLHLPVLCHSPKQQLSAKPLWKRRHMHGAWRFLSLHLQGGMGGSHLQPQWVTTPARRNVSKITRQILLKHFFSFLLPLDTNDCSSEPWYVTHILIHVQTHISHLGYLRVVTTSSHLFCSSTVTTMPFVWMERIGIGVSVLQGSPGQTAGSVSVFF